MFIRTDDPVADFHRHDAEQQAQLDKLPKCSECGDAIQDEICYKFNSKYICIKCVIGNHQVYTEDLMG